MTQACWEMMTRIEAEESLARIAQIAAGNGLMEDRDARNYMRALKRAANGGKREPVMKATVQSLSQIGIPVKTVPTDGEKKDPAKAE